ncbi:glycoside hydrolase family 16 protein [Micromonospora sp. DT31]|uniref:glycoside hydrolase family 16 protein n=1 Tax=Micromonospora sp. DT31 TaxID=3393434 RepID=UPI003CF50449
MRVRAMLLTLVTVLASTFLVGGPAQAATYESTFTNMNVPEFTNSGNQLVTVSGRITPAPVAGRTISLYRVQGDGSTTFVQGTTADAAGNWAMTFAVSVVSTYRFFAARFVSGSNTYKQVTSPNYTVKSLRLWDSFDYPSRTELQNSGKWQLRQGTYETSPQVHNRSSWSAISMHADSPSAVQFNIVADTPAADGSPRYLSPQITAGNLGVVNGHLEARIKFQKPKGAHGALWWQSGYGAGGGEFDVAEFFGKRGDAEQPPFLSQAVQHTIHPTLQTQACFKSWTTTGSTGGGCTGTDHEFLNYDNNTWWNDWHTYEGFWSSDRYIFSIDGRRVGEIGPAQGVTPATTPGEVILSLLVSDGNEYDNLRAHLAGGGQLSDYRMLVDWVRLWR